ncbi:MAG: hypothetical protein KJZ47_11730, partial [Gemmatimonadales bacterium]|nr:hypothetical protein [Gemmatimonadales bacterium]
MSQDIHTPEVGYDANAAGARTGARRLVVGVVAAGLVALAAWALVPRRGAEGPGPAAGEMAGMEGMGGMDMSSDGTVQLTADQVRHFGITFGAVEVRTLEDRIRTTGVVTFDETRIAQVA